MNADVNITNITDDVGVLTIAGPKSKDLLATVTDSKVSKTL
jgi:glycine cleavage system aminomethyltransferase T